MAIQLVVGQGVTHNRQAHDYIRHRMRKDHTATGPVAGSMRLAEVRLATAAGQSGLEGGKLHVEKLEQARKANVLGMPDCDRVCHEETSLE